MRIYLTHCTAKKDDRLKHTDEKVTPDRLYMGKFIGAFMRTCKQRGVNWAILSDKYGVWFPGVRHEWYDKHPSKVTEDEYRELLTDFDQKLQSYHEVYFYRRSGRFDHLYRRLLRETRLRDRITLFSHVAEIA